MRMHNFVLSVVVLTILFYAVRYTALGETKMTIQTTKSGLQYSILQPGNGNKKVEPGMIVKIHYTGWLYKENEKQQQFDSSVGREPLRFMVGTGAVIKGFDEGVRGMVLGEKRTLIIPPSLGYGARQVGPIPPNSTLVFEVELVA